MVVLTVIVAALLSLAALVYVVWPLVDSSPAPVVVENDRLTDLIGRKDAALVAIKELEFDYYTGKLSDEDYERMDQTLRRKAIGLIQQIEKLAPESAVMDERLEAEIAGMRKTQDPEPVALTTAPVAASESTGVPVPVEDGTPVMRYCTDCGQPVQPTHKFCAKCGTPIAAQAMASSG